MRRQDELLLLCDGQHGLACKFLLSQMEGLSAAFDSEELLQQLQRRVTDEDPRIRNQATFSLTRFIPGLVRRRFSVTGLARGIWSSYAAAIRSPADVARAQAEREDQMHRVGQAAVVAAVPLVKLLVAAADHLSPWDRTRATLAMAHLGTKDGRRFLASGLRAGSPELGAGLALAVAEGEGAGPAITAAVRQGAHADPDLFLLLGAVPGAKAFELLVDSIPSAGDVGRMNLARALADKPDADYLEAFDYLCRFKEAYVQAAALSAVESIGKTSAVAAVKRQYDTAGSRFVKTQAVKAAGGLRCPDSAALCEAALSERDPTLNAVALESMIRLKVPVDTLRAAARPLVSSEHVRARVNALIAAYAPDEILYAPEFREMLLRAGPVWRLEAAYCLGYLQTRRSLDVLDALATRDPDPGVRNQAIKAMARYPATISIPFLAQLLRADDPQTVLIAARALGRYDQEDARVVCDALQEALQTEKRPEQRAVIYRALGPSVFKSGSKSGADVLRAGLDEPDSRALGGALDGWLTLDPEEVPSPGGKLGSLSENRDPRIRARALMCRWVQGESDALERLGQGTSPTDAAGVEAVLDCALDLGVLIGEVAAGTRFSRLRKALLGGLDANLSARIEVEGVEFRPPEVRQVAVPAEPDLLKRPSGTHSTVGAPAAPGPRQAPSRKVPPLPRPSRKSQVARSDEGQDAGLASSLLDFLRKGATASPSPGDLGRTLGSVTYLIPQSAGDESLVAQVWRSAFGKMAIGASFFLLLLFWMVGGTGDRLVPPPLPDGVPGHLWVDKASGPIRTGSRSLSQGDVIRGGDLLDVPAGSELKLITPQGNKVVVKGESQCRFDGVGTTRNRLNHYRFRDIAGDVAFEFGTQAYIELRFDRCRLTATGANLAVNRSPDPNTLTVTQGTAQLEFDGNVTKLHRNTTLRIP